MNEDIFTEENLTYVKLKYAPVSDYKQLLLQIPKSLQTKIRHESYFGRHDTYESFQEWVYRLLCKHEFGNK